MKPWLVCDASGILFRVTELTRAVPTAHANPDCATTGSSANSRLTNGISGHAINKE
jgi:hypothetical protein